MARAVNFFDNGFCFDMQFSRERETKACVIEEEMKRLCIKIKMKMISDKLLLNIQRYRAI